MMNIETRILSHNEGFSFDLIDLDDTLHIEDESFPEQLYSHNLGLLCSSGESEQG